MLPGASSDLVAYPTLGGASSTVSKESIAVLPIDACGLALHQMGPHLIISLGLVGPCPDSHGPSDAEYGRMSTGGQAGWQVSHWVVFPCPMYDFHNGRYRKKKKKKPRHYHQRSNVHNTLAAGSVSHLRYPSTAGKHDDFSLPATPAPLYPMKSVSYPRGLTPSKPRRSFAGSSTTVLIIPGTLRIRERYKAVRVARVSLETVHDEVPRGLHSLTRRPFSVNGQLPAETAGGW